jgi:hypothetical protein
MSLSYARVGGVTVLEEPGIGFSLVLGAPDLSRRLISARLTLRSTVEPPLELTFGSGQRFDVVLKNESGGILYRWSDGKAFTLALGMERIAGERNWIIDIPLVLKDSSALPPGSYGVEAWLTTIGDKQYAASARFELAAPGR